MLRVLIVFLGLVVLVACGSGSPDVAVVEPSPGGVQTAPAVLPTPYTAEQIRDAWVEGLSLKMVNTTQYGKQFQRWTVISADAEGAELEEVETDADGTRIGPPRVGRSLWIELRDHARFPANICSRSEVTRETALGELDGWLYVLTDPASDVVTEFFFAHSTPGAPVFMVVKKGGVVVQEMTQEERTLTQGS